MGLGSANVEESIRTEPFAREFGVVVVLKFFRWARLELETQGPSTLEIHCNVKDGFAMLLPWVGAELGTGVYRVHDVRTCSLGKVVEFSNNGAIAEGTIKLRRVQVMSQNPAGLGWHLLLLVGLG